jgi:pyruvate ferredoxin oxidoreductase delta subunit
MKEIKRTKAVGDIGKGTVPLNTGAVIREPGSASRYRTGSWRTFRPVIDQKKCIKCSLCWQNCPDAAIYVDKRGNYMVNYDYCKGCLICVRECPAKAIGKELEQK